MFKSTAIYPNRIRDKKELELKLQLPEEGNSNFLFYNDGNIIAIGYERIVYGDHGAYVEFSKEQIKCNLLSKFNNDFDINKLPSLNYKFYYFWLQPDFNENLKIYLQIKPVHNIPNAPAREDGKKSNFNRKEGYADYKRGFLYINPYNLKILNLNYLLEYIELKTNIKINIQYKSKNNFDLVLNDNIFTMNINNIIDYNDFSTIVNLSNEIINNGNLYK